MSPARRQRLVLWAGAAGAGAVLALAGAALWPRFLEELHLRRLGSEDVDVRCSAAEALGNLGSVQAVPRLLDLLAAEAQKYEPEMILAAAMVNVGASAAPGKLEDPTQAAPEYVYREAIMKVGPPAIPELVRALEELDPLRQALAARFLGRLASAASEPRRKAVERAVDALLRALRREDPLVVDVSVVEALAACGPSVSSRVVEVAWGGGAQARVKALAVLARLPEAVVETLPAIQGALRDQEAGVRTAAVLALGRLCGAERAERSEPLVGLEFEMLVALLEMLGDPDLKVRVAVLGAVGWNYAGLARFVVDNMRVSPEALVREALGQDTGPRTFRAAAVSGACADVFVAALDDPMAEVQRFALESIALFGPRAAPVAPRLVRMVREGQLGLWDAAIDALLAVEPAAVPGLLEGLENLSPPLRRRVLEALGSMSWEGDLLARAGKALDGVRPRLTDKDEGVREAALGALAALAPRAPGGLRRLAALLDSEEPLERLAAARILKACGKSAREAVPGLLRGLKDPLDELRAACARTLGEVREDREAVIVALLEALRTEPVEAVVEAIARSLAALRPDTAGAGPVLREVLRGPGSPAAKKIVLWHLGGFGGLGDEDRLDAALAALGGDRALWPQALRMLEALGPKGLPAATRLRALLAAADEEAAVAFVTTLNRLRAWRAEDLPFLRERLGSASSAQLKGALTAALAQAGEASPPGGEE
ncbi:MAG: HEAT repeat domain-containing protein [Planctomycetes bacterium]|nr:HEAT repeat domain-containing protein [Planctomycetota bacterium]